MKKLILCGMAALALAACSTAQVQKLATPQALITDFCPIVNADLNVLKVSPLLTPAQQKIGRAHV